mgnify:CR=1 FL=1
MITKEKASGQFVYQIYLFLILFTYTDGFGLRGDGMWGGLGNASLGSFGILQLVLMAMSLYFMFTSGPLLFIPRTKTSNAVKWFMYLFILIMIELVVQSLFDVNKLTKFGYLIRLKNWILLFVIPALYKRVSVQGLVNVIKFSGIIASIIVLFVITQNIEGTAIKTLHGTAVTHALRVMIPTGSLITFAFYLFLSSLKHSRSVYDIAGLLICFLATFIQLHRSSTLSLIVVTVAFLLLEYKMNVGKSAIIIVAGVALLGVLFGAVGYSFDTLFEVFSTTRSAVSTGDDAGTSMRFGMIGNALTFVISNYVIFGIGLDWIMIEDTDMYNYLKFAETPTADNGFYNIIIVFGVLGLAIFLIMLYRLLTSVWKNKKIVTEEKVFMILNTGICYYLIYNVMVAMGGDRFFFDVIFPIVIGMILMNEKSMPYILQKEIVKSA